MIRPCVPLGLLDKHDIRNNAISNHSSAIPFAEAIDEYLSTKTSHGALLSPFNSPPHKEYTWAPLMTRPKGVGRRVILDLSYGEFSVNKATNIDSYDQLVFKLKLPNLNCLLPELERLGSDARLFKIDISRAFRNVRLDPADAIHVGIKWRNKFYIDKNLAFGAVHGTAIFERITDLVRFVLAKRGFIIHNYIDDIYACCHKERAHDAFNTLLAVIRAIGLPINPQKVFLPCTSLTIMGIKVNIQTRTFCIDDKKLQEIFHLCCQYFVRDIMTKREVQSLLGKLLYISRCVRGSRIFLNNIFQTLRDNHHQSRFTLEEKFYWDLWWFIKFPKQFNGVVQFQKHPVTHFAFVDATLSSIGGM